MKKCPFCAEDIQDVALKCRYCGEWMPFDEKRDEKEKPTEETEIKRIIPEINLSNNVKETIEQPQPIEEHAYVSTNFNTAILLSIVGLVAAIIMHYFNYKLNADDALSFEYKLTLFINMIIEIGIIMHLKKYLSNFDIPYIEKWLNIYLASTIVSVICILFIPTEGGASSTSAFALFMVFNLLLAYVILGVSCWKIGNRLRDLEHDNTQGINMLGQAFLITFGYIMATLFVLFAGGGKTADTILNTIGIFVSIYYSAALIYTFNEGKKTKSN